MSTKNENRKWIQTQHKPNRLLVFSFSPFVLEHSQLDLQRKKKPILIPKSYFIYFKTPFYNLSNILFINFHITLNTIHFLFISVSFSLSLSLHSSVSLFSLHPHIKPHSQKKKRLSSHHTHQESSATTITTTIIITYPYQNSNKKTKEMEPNFVSI